MTAPKPNGLMPTPMIQQTPILAGFGVNTMATAHGHVVVLFAPDGKPIVGMPPDVAAQLCGLLAQFALKAAAATAAPKADIVVAHALPGIG